MSEKVDIFGIKFDNLTTAQIAARLLEEINSNREKPLIVFTPNPEIVMSAQKDAHLFEALKSADIICPDGVGVVWASKYFGTKIKERASGVDVVLELFNICEKSGVDAFFFGGTKDAVTKAAANMQSKFRGLNVCGVKSGYIEIETTSSQNTNEMWNSSIIDTINNSGAGLLLVGLGSPKQEMWVFNNAQSLNVKVIMVVGGSFDVMSGNLKRAPAFFRKLGLEWFYRLLRQPKRLFRMLKLPRFVLKTLFSRRKVK